MRHGERRDLPFESEGNVVESTTRQNDFTPQQPLIQVPVCFRVWHFRAEQTASDIYRK